MEPGAIQTEFDDIMAEPMLKRSGQGPYAKMAKANYEKGAASDPKVITDLILKAVHAKRPKTRYVAGKYAKPMMLARKWAGDRIFDKMVMTMAK